MPQLPQEACPCVQAGSWAEGKGTQQQNSGIVRARFMQFCNRKCMTHLACDAGPCCFETPSRLDPRKVCAGAQGSFPCKDSPALQLHALSLLVALSQPRTWGPAPC